MSSAESLCYTLINPTNQDDEHTEQQIKADIEDLKADNKSKAEALKPSYKLTPFSLFISQIWIS